MVSGQLKKKNMTSISSKPGPAIWTRDTDQRIPCFDRCQLTVTRMSNIKDICCKPGLHDLVLAGRVHPRCMPLAMLTTKKELHGFLFLSGAEQKTPEICVSGSSTKKWRHIRFKLCRAARFTTRKNGVSIGEDFPLFANHQVRVLSYWG